MEPQVSDDAFNEAMAYLRRRLDAERSMSYNLEIIMREAAERIVDICYSHKPQWRFSFDSLPASVRQQIDRVIEWLESTIDDYFITLAVAEHEENREMILPYILAENHGAKFIERLKDYCSKYKDELMLLVGAGLFLNIGKSALGKSIGDHLSHPYSNHLLAEGIEAPLSYGRGRSNSMYNAIEALTRFGIGRAWMYNRHLEAMRKEAAGFITFRNSSCPCDMCDEYASRFHPIDDEIPPLHLSCVCGMIYVNDYGEPLNF